METVTECGQDKVEKKIFDININKYVCTQNFKIFRPSSLDYPLNNSVMFVIEKYIDKWKKLLSVKKCLIFWPETKQVPTELSKYHAVVPCKNTRLEYCRFFKENNIMNLPELEKFHIVNGAFISSDAQIGKETVIMPGAYIGGKVKIGHSSYIGAGAKLMGIIVIGSYSVIRENTVIGADGLSTDRDEDGSAISMPQFGGVRIGDNVNIGANCVISRGAIDDTIIEDGCKIDNSAFISHNVHLGRDTFIVGETIMFGSSSTGERAYISGNSTIRNKVKIGSDVFVGMGSVVTRDVKNGITVLGNPAHEKE